MSALFCSSRGEATPLRRARTGRDAAALLFIALAALAATSARADDEGPKDGIPEGSIATSMPGNGDPGGIRKSLSERGITYGFNYIGEVLSNVTGGTHKRTVYTGRLEGWVETDLEKLAGWKGLTFHANAYQIHGQGLSRDYIGNLMAVSYIEAQPTTRLFELWLDQKLLDDKLSIRFGQLATDAEFIVSGYATQFINGTFGWPAIMGSDMPSGGAGYPFATPGVRVKIDPTKQISALVGVYNGDPAGQCGDDPQRCNRYGTNFRVSDSPLLIGELQYRYNQDKGASGLAGTVKIGAWHHFGRFDDQRIGADGLLLADPNSAGALSHRNNTGIYGVIDQQLWRPASGEPDKGIGLFFRGAAAPSDRNLVDLYFDGGLVFAGLVPGRPDDSFGFGLAYARISDRVRAFDADDIALNGTVKPIRDYEAAFEFNYAAQILPGWMIDADFQYIWHPGGGVVNDNDPSGGPVRNTAVIGVHTAIKY